MASDPQPDDRRTLVRLYTDGACIGNPGPGGWAFILKHPASGRVKEGHGGEHNTTNNRMEIMAVIKGLESIRTSCRVAIFSDSQYVVKAIDQWIEKWKRFGWKRSKTGQADIRNLDLWKALDEQLQRHAVNAHWVKGHAGHRENERCDELADAAAAQIAKAPAPKPLSRQHANDLFDGASS